MWPFKSKKSHQETTRDPLTAEVSLEGLGPFHEADRSIITWPNALAASYALDVVYENTAGDRVHIVHSPKRGGAMETHCEWLGTAVRQRDHRAVALFLAWPRTDLARRELIRVWFIPDADGLRSPVQQIVMNPNGTVDEMTTKPRTCFYADVRYCHPRRHPDDWAQVLGCPVATFSESEWGPAADKVDPDHSEREAIEQAEDDAYEEQIETLKKLGIYDTEPEPQPEPQTGLFEPSPEQQQRLLQHWSQRPEILTAQVGAHAIGGGNLGNPHHPSPLIGLVVVEDDPHSPDFSGFRGAEEVPPSTRKIELWDSNLLVIENGSWRIVVCTGDEQLPGWWFDAAAADPEQRPYGIVTVHFASEGSVRAAGMESLDIRNPPARTIIGLASLEDCRPQ